VVAAARASLLGAGHRGHWGQGGQVARRGGGGGRAATARGVGARRVVARPLRQVVCAPRRLRLLALLAPVRIDAPATTLRPRGTGSVGDSVGEGRSRPPPGPSQRGQGVREGEGKGRPGRLTAYSHSDSPFTPASPPRVRVCERACVYSRRADAGVYAGGEQRYAAGQQRCKLHTP
jgi:hypothetical protein